MSIVTAWEERFQPLWARLFASDPLMHPLYTPLNAAYSIAYAAGWSFEDLSFLVEERGVPLIGVIVSLGAGADGQRELSAFGRPILCIEAVGSATAVRAANRQLRERFQRLLEQSGADRAHLRNYGGRLTGLAQLLLDSGAAATPHFTQQIDLTLSEEELHRQLRKSYTSQINWGLKSLQIRTVEAAMLEPDDMETFRRLHVEAAGRETRSRRSWELQGEMIRAGEAFAILGCLEGRLVTAAFFNYSPNYCYYGVSASNRDLFELPLSHAILWSAILAAKRLGCRVLEMGEQLYSGQPREPSAKELGIATFKRGFGGETRVDLDIRWARPAQEAGQASPQPEAGADKEAAGE